MIELIQLLKRLRRKRFADAASVLPRLSQRRQHRIGVVVVKCQELGDAFQAVNSIVTFLEHFLVRGDLNQAAPRDRPGFPVGPGSGHG